MFCPKCGKEIPDQAAFCPKCGNAIKASPKTPEISKSLKIPKNLKIPKIGKLQVKNPVRLGCLILALVLLTGITAHALTSKTYKWKKSHLEDGTMYIYTVDELPGTATDASGKKSKIYSRLNQDKDGFFLTVKDSNKKDIVNTGGGPLTVRATITFITKVSKEDFPQDFTGTMASGSNIIHFNLDSTGYLQGTVQQDYPQSKPLSLTFPDGSVYHVTIPEKTNYHEIWEKASNFWDIPTFNDDIYIGDKVNPDLVSYLEDFEDALYAELDERKAAGAARTVLETLLDINTNPKLNAMYKKYESMECLPRRVDADYYGECRARVNAALIEYALSQGLELYQTTTDLARYFGLN